MASKGCSGSLLEVVGAIDHDVQSVFCLNQAAVFLDQVIDIPRRRQVHASAYMYESAYEYIYERMRYYMHAQTLACGDMYEGDWKDDRKSGKGAYTWAYGDMYEGGYRDNKRMKRARKLKHMVICMKEIGKMTRRMERVRIHGLMGICMKGITKVVR